MKIKKNKKDFLNKLKNWIILIENYIKISEKEQVKIDQDYIITKVHFFRFFWRKYLGKVSKENVCFIIGEKGVGKLF